jgi:hypothetical protein
MKNPVESAPVLTSSSVYALVNITGLRFPKRAATPVRIRSGSGSDSSGISPLCTTHRKVGDTDVDELYGGRETGESLSILSVDLMTGLRRVNLGLAGVPGSSSLCVDILLIALTGPAGRFLVPRVAESGTGPAIECRDCKDGRLCGAVAASWTVCCASNLLDVELPSNSGIDAVVDSNLDESELSLPYTLKVALWPQGTFSRSVISPGSAKLALSAPYASDSI